MLDRRCRCRRNYFTVLQYLRSTAELLIQLANRIGERMSFGARTKSASFGRCNFTVGLIQRVALGFIHLQLHFSSFCPIGQPHFRIGIKFALMHRRHLFNSAFDAYPVCFRKHVCINESSSAIFPVARCCTHRTPSTYNAVLLIDVALLSLSTQATVVP